MPRPPAACYTEAFHLSPIDGKSPVLNCKATGGSMYIGLELFPLGVAVAIYIAIVIIFWRNLTLSQPWKAIFSLSVLPVFLIAMVVNVWLTDTYAPWLFDALRLAAETGDEGSEVTIGFVITTPIALAISLVWYLLIRAADGLAKEDVPELDV